MCKIYFFPSEYHLGRKAFRLCKKGTKYCAWHREMPEFKQWISACAVGLIKYKIFFDPDTLNNYQTYDHFRDSYKLYIDGEQVESGTWAGDNPQDPIRPGDMEIVDCC